MSTKKLSNISISQFESFLELAKCKFIKSSKGHCQYTRSDLNRPLTFQNHIDPIPEFIVRNLLRGLGYSRKQFFEILEGKTIVKKDKKNFILESVKKK